MRPLTDGPPAERPQPDRPDDDASAPRPEPPDASAVAVAPVDAAPLDRAPPARPGACDAPVAARRWRTPVQEGFEPYAAGPVDQAAGTIWTRALTGRRDEVVSFWPRTGTHSLAIQSFVAKRELAYAPLALQELPSRVTIELGLALDSFIAAQDFAAFGLVRVHSKYDAVPVLELRVDHHQLLLTRTGSSVPLYLELRQADSTTDQTTPSYNLIRVEIDLCRGQLDAWVGGPGPPVHQMSAPIDPIDEVQGFFVAGGISTSYVDDVKVDVETAN